MIRALLLVVALFASLPPHASAAYNALYVFGDSLSDNGNAFALSTSVPGFDPWPPSPPYAQRFSNGPVAAERLADRLGIPHLPATSGGTNYAVGGATTGLLNFNFETQTPVAIPSTVDNTGILAQVGSFIGASPVFDPNASLFMVWGAPNDFFLGLATSADLIATAATAAQNLAAAIVALASAGATDFLVPNMPNLAKTPFGFSRSLAEQDALSALSTGFNLGLQAALGQVELLLPNINLIAFDTAAYFDEVIDDPSAFGLTNVQTPCLNPNDPNTPTNLEAGCPGFLFFDAVHPTAAAHLQLGDAFRAAVPEPATWWLVALGLSFIALRHRPTGF